MPRTADDILNDASGDRGSHWQDQDTNMTVPAMNDAALRAETAAEEAAASAAEAALAWKFDDVELLNGRANNLLIRNPNPGPTRVHIETNGRITSGTTTKVDKPFDCYQDDPSNYRITAFFGYVGDPNGTGEAAVEVINAKSIGSHWGMFPWWHWAFFDDGPTGTLLKVGAVDYLQPQHYTPARGGWYAGDTYAIGDYVTSSNRIYVATTAGVAGDTAPSHTSGSASDGGVTWDWVFSPSAARITPMMMIGGRDQMPILGHADAKFQLRSHGLIDWGKRFFFVDENGAEIGSLNAVAGSGGERFVRLLMSNGGYLRVGQTNKTIQTVGLAMAGSQTVAADGATSIDVAGVSDLAFASTAATSVATLTGAAANQRLFVTSSNSNTRLVHNGGATTGGVIWCPGGQDVVIPQYGAIELVASSTGGAWRVVGTVSTERVIWTPTATFATPGDLSMAYSGTSAWWRKLGSRVMIDGSITFTPTYTTASGELRIPLPFTALAGNTTFAINLSAVSAFTWPSSATQIMAQIPGGASYMRIIGLKSASSPIAADTTTFPTGVAATLRFNGSYDAAA